MTAPAGTAPAAERACAAPLDPHGEEAQALFARPWSAAVARARARAPGALVAGCFPVWFPAEIVRAAGGVPIALFGGGGEVEVARADARFQSFVCSIAKTTLELGLRGDLAGLDAILFGSICDVARNLASVFERNFGARLYVDYLHYPQNPSSPAALDWFEEELWRVTAGLANRAGRPVTDAGLNEAILLQNCVRAALRELYDLRRLSPERLPTSELYRLARLAAVLPAEEAVALLDGALARASERRPPPRDAVRVVVEGAFCEQPPLDLVRVLEEAGLAIVDDDFHVGTRWFDGPIPCDGGERPIRRIARAFLEGSTHSSVHRPAGPARTERLLARVRQSRAQGVVLVAAKFCEPALLDQVLHRRALDQAGIPHLRLEYEEKQWTFERLRGEVETFVESLLFD